MAQALTAPVQQRLIWLVALVGFSVMYLPTYWWAFNTIWQTEEQAHGAIVLVVVAWLFWHKREAILTAAHQPNPMVGWPLFLFGLLLYIVGRAIDISIFEIGSQIPVLTGALLILAGGPAVRAAWFPLLYVVFMIPLPGVLVDALTVPLKEWISVITTNTLYAFGYPIARNGVMLTIGQYELLVADACSGLHSMFSLSALGILFMYLTARASVLHNAIMLASILPIAFASNIVRVMVLVLITYHLGDEMGQGFLHGTASIVLLLMSLGFLLMLDVVLVWLIKPKAGLQGVGSKLPGRAP